MLMISTLGRERVKPLCRVLTSYFAIYFGLKHKHDSAVGMHAVLDREATCASPKKSTNWVLRRVLAKAAVMQLRHPEP